MRFTHLPSVSSAVLVAVSACCLFLSGCSFQSPITSQPDLARSASLAGTVYGGQQPITGAQVYLLAVNPTGYGGPGISPATANASVSLLNPASTGNAANSLGSYVLTNNTNGGFTITGDYNCSSGYAQSSGSAVPLSGTEQVYLYALGGNTGTSVNPYAGLLVALGPCNNPATKVTINEATTIATAYAFAGFASDATHIGSSGSALALTNLNVAFANVANLVSSSTGVATPNSATTTAPVANLYTLADILAACVDSATAGASCPTLFQYAASAGASGITATDTATAAINLAHNPWPTQAGMNALYKLVPATGAPFPGALTSQPNDFTLSLIFSGGGLYNPTDIAIDALGNAWVSDSGLSGTKGNSHIITELASNGTPISPSTGFAGTGLNDPFNIAIDATGNVWLSNYLQNANFTEFSSSGVQLSPTSGYPTTAPFIYPGGVAIDTAGNVWAGNSRGSTLNEISNTGSLLSGNGYSGGGLYYPQGAAFDRNGNIWLADGLYAVSEFSSNGAPISPSTGYGAGGATQPVGIAIDPTGNVWVTNLQYNSVSELTGTGVGISPSTGYTANSLVNPNGIAIDSAGNAWVTSEGNYVTEFSPSGTVLSPPLGFAYGSFNVPYSMSIDGAGNLWIPNYSGSTLTEIIGAASPVVTPIVANLLPPYNHPASRP